MTEAKKSNLIAKLIEEALGDLYAWKKPVSSQSIGPAFPEKAEKFAYDISLVKEELRNKLAQHSMASLMKNYQAKELSGVRTLTNPNSVEFQIVKKISDLKRNEPAWFIAGWHVQELELELAHWRAFSSCNLVELTLLSVGLDPRRVGYSVLFKRYGHSQEQDDMLMFLEDRYEAIANGLNLDTEKEDESVEIEVFYRWVNKNKLQIDQRFRRLLREKCGPISNQTVAIAVVNSSHVPLEPQKIHRRTYDFHAELLYTIAVEKFNLNDIKNVGIAAKKIQICSELQGGTASLQPIKKLLLRGHELIEAKTKS